MMIRKTIKAIIFLCVIALMFTKYASNSSGAIFHGNSDIFIPLIHSPYPTPSPGEPGYCLTDEEFKLVRLINEYRVSSGLPAAPLSRSLTMVAQWHVRDLIWNNPNSGTDDRGLKCNMHSWSDQGDWLPVCYTSDHYYASGMWYKPDEITKGIYTDFGYEIAAGAKGWHASASGALNLWKGSPSHNDVIIEEGIWKESNWPAMGVGIYRGYAVTWFSSSNDPLGTVPTCE
jgi:hypothetical protein